MNDRLKQVDFHGRITHPLYIQVTYDRKTIFFKSYYFELFSKSRYAQVKPDGNIIAPKLELIVEKEIEVIDFVIEKLKDGFSLEAFKKLYSYFSQDLCEVTERDFITHLCLFFQKRGMPHMAELIKWGTQYLVTYDLMMDFKKMLKKDLYKELLKQSIRHAPPYLQLYSFMMHKKKPPIVSLTALDWERIETVSAFKNFVELNYPDMNTTQLIGQVNNWPKYSRIVY